MATFHIKLDGRRCTNGKFPVVVSINNKGTKTTKDIGIWVKQEHWTGGNDGVYVSRTCPMSKKINDTLNLYNNKYRSLFIRLQSDASIDNMTATEIADVLFERVTFKKTGTLQEDLLSYIAASKSKNTAYTYQYTYNNIYRYSNGANVSYSSVTYEWLTAFDRWMQEQGLKINTRGIVLRNIRVLYNEAIRKGYVSIDKYPFRTFKIKTVAKEKDFLRPEDIIRLRDMPLKGRAAYTRDFFLLSLYLGGINPVDLYHLKRFDAKNKIQYQRQKIKDRTDSYVSLKVQPEAMEIVERYADPEYLVNFINNYSTFRTFYSHARSEIKKIGKELGYPNLTLYWARYTWATIADDIDIPSKLISRVLGHKEQSLADKHYIVAFNWDRADRANRFVLDHIFNTEKIEEAI